MVLCAVVVTSLVVRKELFPRDPDGSRPVEVKDWEQVAKVGNVMGRPDAPIKIVEFSDFQCPFCARVQTSLREVRSRYGDSVAVVYRHFPLDAIHPHAFDAALASACAGAQGRFEPYHDALYERQDSIGVSSWSRLAEIAGVRDLAAFDDCVTERRFEKQVSEDVRVAREIGVSSTPSLIIGGKLRSGSASAQEMDSWIREALEEQKRTAR
jgi:protein-disulfide isomerase